MFGTAFDSLLDEDHKNIKLVPQKLEKTIDEINSWIYVSEVCNCRLLTD